MSTAVLWIMGEGERVFRSNYKGHMDKTMAGGVESGEGGGDGWGGEWSWGEMQTTVLGTTIK